MTKIKTIALVTLLAIATGCSSKGSSGGTNPNADPSSGNETSSSTGGGDSSTNENSPIVGRWTTSSASTWVDPSTGNYADTSAFIDVYEFATNGTYKSLTNAVGGNYTAQGTVWQRGNYSVQDNVLYKTNIIETFECTNNPSWSHTNKSYPDTKHPFHFNSDGNLYIDFFASDGSILESTLRYYRAE